MQKHTLRVFMLLLSLTLLCTSCSLLSNEEQPLAPPLASPKAATITTHKVTRGDVTVLFNIETQCTSSEIYTFNMPASAIVKSYKMVEGSYLTKGTVLAKIDTGMLELNVLQAEVAMIEATNHYNSIKNSADTLTAKRAEVSMREATINYEELKLNLEQSQFIMPIDGFVQYQNKDVVVGEEAPYGTPLFVILDKTALRLHYFDMNEEGLNASRFHVGEKVRIATYKDNGDEVIVEGTVDAAPDLYPDLTDHDEAAMTGRRTVIISFDEKDSIRFFYNKDYTVSKVVNERKNVLFVPRSAVKTYQQRTYVYIKDENNLRIERDVAVGVTDSQIVEITSGLKEGEEVVIS